MAQTIERTFSTDILKLAWRDENSEEHRHNIDPYNGAHTVKAQIAAFAARGVIVPEGCVYGMALVEGHRVKCTMSRDKFMEHAELYTGKSQLNCVRSSETITTVTAEWFDAELIYHSETCTLYGDYQQKRAKAAFAKMDIHPATNAVYKHETRKGEQYCVPREWFIANADKTEQIF